MQIFLIIIAFFSSTIFANTEVFFKLKSVGQFWRQLIDGKDQMYGELVYDQGLHGGHVEPGFLQGVLDASEAAPGLFVNDLTLDAYRELHTKATAYQPKQPTIRPNSFFEERPPDPNGPRTKEVRETLESSMLQRFIELSDVEAMTIKQASENVTALAAAMAKKYNNGAAFVNITLYHDDDLVVTFLQTPGATLSRIANQIFDDFNRSDKTLERISTLYRELELLHFFQDGNTRTNLILINWLLAREGFTPVIFQEPALPIFLTEIQSNDLFRRGMDEWTKEAHEQNQQRHFAQKAKLAEITKMEAEITKREQEITKRKAQIAELVKQYQF